VHETSSRESRAVLEKMLTIGNELRRIDMLAVELAQNQRDSHKEIESLYKQGQMEQGNQGAGAFLTEQLMEQNQK
jgi:hypothetical protein